jgi:hypothetical protein
MKDINRKRRKDNVLILIRNIKGLKDKRKNSWATDKENINKKEKKKRNQVDHR